MRLHLSPQTHLPRTRGRQVRERPIGIGRPRLRRPGSPVGRVAIAVVLALIVAGCGSPLVAGSAAPAPAGGSPAGAGKTGSTTGPRQATGTKQTAANGLPQIDPQTGALGTPQPANSPALRQDRPSTGQTLPMATAVAVPTETGGSTPALPSWVVPGMRVTFEVLGAQLSLNNVWVEDPNGQWVDQATGKHYSEQVSGNPNGGRNGMAGEGYAQYDIMGVTSGKIAYTTTQYFQDPSSGSLSQMSVTAGSEGDGSLISVFMNPATLAQMVQHPVAGYLYLTGPYQVGQTTFQAVSIVNTSAASPSTQVYDLKTGLVLQILQSTQTTDQTQTSVSYVGLANARQVDLPGLNGSNPSWVGSSGALSYTGTYTSQNAVNKQSAPVTITLNYQRLQGQLMQVTQTMTANGQQAGSQTQVAGPAGPYWMDPSALAKLTSGQVIDRDPLTGATITVDQVASGQVTIDSSDGGTQTAAVYDTGSGRLEQLQTQSSSSTLAVSLQGS